MTLRDRDVNTDWDAAPDGTLEGRSHCCRDWRTDVVGLVSDAGQLLHQVRCDPYGVPFGISKADIEADGDVDNADYTAWLAEGQKQACEAAVRTAAILCRDICNAWCKKTPIPSAQTAQGHGAVLRNTGGASGCGTSRTGGGTGDTGVIDDSCEPPDSGGIGVY